MLGILLAFNAYSATQQPETTSPTESSDFVAISNNGYFLNGAIYRYNESNVIGENQSSFRDVKISQKGKTHPILASGTISEEALRQYLTSKGSPLVGYSSQILTSPFWSTIIGITDAEESFSKNPYGSNNLYGLMSHGAIIRFNTLLDGFNAESNWLANHLATHPTIESLDGYYVQPYSESWLETVISVKIQVENLDNP